MNDRQPCQTAGPRGQTPAASSAPPGRRPPAQLVMAAVMWIGLGAWGMYRSIQQFVRYSGLAEVPGFSRIVAAAYAAPILSLIVMALSVLLAILMLSGRRSGRAGLLVMFIVNAVLTAAGLLANWAGNHSIGSPVSLLEMIGGVPGLLEVYIVPWVLQITAVVLSYARSSSAYLRPPSDAVYPLRGFPPASTQSPG